MVHQELLWKYAEGECSPAEVGKVEELLANDDSLQQELDQILTIHTSLQSMETAAPSMRFSQNVLDALPDIYPAQMAIEPLVRPVFKKIFWIGFVATLAAIFLLYKTGVSSSGKVMPPYLEQLSSNVQTALATVNIVVVQYAVLTLLSITLLAVIDRLFLKKKKALMMF